MTTMNDIICQKYNLSHNSKQKVPSFIQRTEDTEITHVSKVPCSGTQIFSKRSRQNESRLISHIICIAVTLLVHMPQVHGQQCPTPPPVLSIKETVPAGTEVFNVTAPANFSFSYNISNHWSLSYFREKLDTSAQIYHLLLNKSLDLEEIYQVYNITVSTVIVSVSCRPPGFIPSRSQVIVYVQPVNEFDPTFNTSSIEVSVKETIAVNTVIITLRNWASDEDINTQLPEISDFQFLPYTGHPQNNGSNWLTIILFSGAVLPCKPLDFESLPEAGKYVTVPVCVRDQGGRTGTASLTVHVEDEDDLPPRFLHDSYSASVPPNITGPITNILPAPIEARDGDSLDYTISYHLFSGAHNFQKFIAIDSDTGQVIIIQELGNSGYSDWILIVEAREVSSTARSNTTTLHISVESVPAEGTATLNSNDQDLIIVAIILAVIIFIIIVVVVAVLVYFRKRYKKLVYPEVAKKESEDGSVVESKVTKTRTPPALHSKEEEISWAPMTYTKDTIDLSDEETVKTNKEAHLYNLDSAYEGSDKTRVSEGSVTHLQDPETDYAEVDGSHEKLKMKNISAVTPESTLSVLPVSGTLKRSHLSDPDPIRERETSSEKVKVDDTETDESNSSESKTAPVATRRKRPRKHMKASLSLEAEVFDGTQDYSDKGVDSGFYTDTSKTRIKRSTRLPVTKPDPNDTRYWITVTDDY